MIIVPAKHILAEKLAKSTSNEEPIMVQYKRLCEGAELPTDNMDTAKALLNDLIKQYCKKTFRKYLISNR